MRLNVEFSHKDVETLFRFDSEYPNLEQIHLSIEFLEELAERLENIKDEMLRMKPFN